MGINLTGMSQTTQSQQTISLSQASQSIQTQFNQPIQTQSSQPILSQSNQPIQSQSNQYTQSLQHSQTAVSLKKGQKVDLTKSNPGLKNIVIGLGWDTNKYDGGFQFDLDSAAFLLPPTGKVNDSTDFVFYNNPTHVSGSVIHTGDNRTGAGDGDDEQIKILLNKVPSQIEKIAFTVTIDEAQQRQQNFGQVSNAYIRIYNADTNEELLYYDLDEDFSIETAIVVAEIYRHNGEWKFNAIGSGFQGGLAALCNNFGVIVQ